MISTTFPSPRTLSPISFAEPAVPNVAQPYSDEVFRVATSSAIAPQQHYVLGDYYLQQSPRDDLDVNPTARFFNNDVNDKGKYRTIYSSLQNIVGGIYGGDNVNFPRGNTFAVGYDPNNVFKRQQYAVTGEKIKMNNPTVISNSPFYPMTDYPLRFDRQFKSFPYFNNFINGMPTYVFPYNLDSTNMENFNNMASSDWLTSILGLIVVIFITYCVYKFIKIAKK